MLVDRRVPLSLIARMEGWSIVFLLGFSGFVYAIDRLTTIQIDLPIAITATLGTAVAVLLGFKNNSAYGRWWEARKIWGSIINSSRFFTCQLIAYLDQRDAGGDSEYQAILSDLIKRQLGYVNILRSQLRGQDTDDSIQEWLTESDAACVRVASNQATMLLTRQADVLRELCNADKFEQFRLFELMATMKDMVTLQGGAERIKNTPLMRHYSWFTTLFVWVFLLLLPFCFWIWAGG